MLKLLIDFKIDLNISCTDNPQHVFKLRLFSKVILDKTNKQTKKDTKPDLAKAYQHMNVSNIRRHFGLPSFYNILGKTLLSAVNKTQRNIVHSRRCSPYIHSIQTEKVHVTGRHVQA